MKMEDLYLKIYSSENHEDFLKTARSERHYLRSGTFDIDDRFIIYVLRDQKKTLGTISGIYTTEFNKITNVEVVKKLKIKRDSIQVRIPDKYIPDIIEKISEDSSELFSKLVVHLENKYLRTNRTISNKH